MNAVVPPHPNPKAIPHLWNYKELRPLLLRAGELVTAEEAERRVLMLINPALRTSPHSSQ
jgi:gentisate 1,2-dioxygenase